ncbi:MAG: ELWxxDGT repeat protein [Saprospiraceae bacterium]
MNTNKYLLLFCIVVLQFNLSTRLAAQTDLIKDINPDGGWSSIEYLFEIGDIVYFTARDGSDVELWRSDGTTAGTVILKEINPGSDSANPSNFTALGDKWYFTAEDGDGVELWVTDGTEAGTNLVKDVNPGFFSSNPRNLTVVGSQLFFSATTQSAGREIWVTDGTEAGTQLVRDIFTGMSSASPTEFVNLNGVLLFSARTSDDNYELWRSDGTAIGTQLVKDIIPGIGGSSPTQFVIAANKLFFTANDDLNGRELWQSDGTEAGTMMVQDIHPGFESSTPTQLTSIGDKLFFTADDGVNGTEFWWTDGSAALPNLMLENIYPGQDSSFATDFFAGENLLYFVASDGMNSLELWRSDGTENGTFLLRDINPGFNSSNIKIIAEVANTLFFEAFESVHGVELWKTDGTPENTVLVKDINPGPEFSNPLNFRVNGDDLYFTAFEPEKLWQVWRSNPVTNETFVVTELPSEEFNGGLYKPQYIKRDGEQIFVVHFGIGVGEEYWRFTPEPFVINQLTTNSPLLCNGNENGTIEVDFSGGLGADNQLSFDWNDGSLTGATLSNLAAGDYTVTVTDCGGNTVVSTTTIAEASAMVVNTIDIMNPNCNGTATGSINLTMMGGAAGYTYQWSNNATTNMLSGLAAGPYNVTVTDSNDCIFEENFMVNETDPILVAAVATNAVSCFGGTDGVATTTPSGGMGTYSFLWSNAMTTSTIMDLGEGTYFVTVTDANNCTATDEVTITQPMVITAIATETMPAACGGGTLGEATVNSTGGTGTYQYLWDNNETNATASLTAGMHSVTITDANNCTQVASVDISEQANFITAINPMDISCLGATDGQAMVAVTGNSSDYSFIWNNGATTAMVGELAIGSYTVTVTNNIDGCVQVDNVEVAGAVASANLDNSISCFGLNDGQATVSINNGAGNYSYLWSNNEMNATANNLMGGMNSVTVTDDSNCSVVLAVEVVEPVALTVSTQLLADASCFGFLNGEASATAQGGTGTYSYAWSSGSMMATANNLGAGTSTVTVTDANNCTTTETIEVAQPDELLLIGSSVDAVGAGANGTASVEVTGGTEPYTYLWNTTPAQTTQSITDLVAGDYEVDVTDANGCLKSILITVDMKVAVSEITGLAQFDVLPNPTVGNTTVQLTFEDTQAFDLQLFDVMGRALLYRTIPAARTHTFDLDLSSFANGVYYLRLKVGNQTSYKKIIRSNK